MWQRLHHRSHGWHRWFSVLGCVACFLEFSPHEQSIPGSQRPARHPDLPGQHDFRRAGGRGRCACHLEPLAGARQQLVLATKVAGPSRGTSWVRTGKGMTAADIVASCEGSLRRLQTDVIDLYQIHWPERHVPAFGNLYYDPVRETSATPIREQLDTLAGLVKAGKVRAIGLSNETPYGVHEFVRLAEQHGLPRLATVQNPYCLINRTWENGLAEPCHRRGVSLLAFSPLGFGLLTGKYDQGGATGPSAPRGARITVYESMRKQRWGRAEALLAARRYNALARANGLTPTQMALAFCYTKWQVSSTIIGVTSVAQLDENLNAWGTTLSPEVLQGIDAIRWEIRDPAL